MHFEAVREARIQAGLTQAAVAQAVGHGLAWLYQIERGLTIPSRKDAERIGELLQSEPEALFSKIRDRSR